MTHWALHTVEPLFNFLENFLNFTLPHYLKMAYREGVRTLTTLTLLENVRIPMDFSGLYQNGERDERAMHLLSLVGLESHAHDLPAQLSGGQQQAAAIARALANDPPIIATDEPTGNLDSVSAENVIRLFEELVDGGKTILMVTHDDELASRASRTIALADGRVISGA